MEILFSLSFFFRPLGFVCTYVIHTRCVEVCVCVFFSFFVFFQNISVSTFLLANFFCSTHHSSSLAISAFSVSRTTVRCHSLRGIIWMMDFAQTFSFASLPSRLHAPAWIWRCWRCVVCVFVCVCVCVCVCVLIMLSSFSNFFFILFFGVCETDANSHASKLGANIRRNRWNCRGNRVGSIDPDRHSLVWF